MTDDILTRLRTKYSGQLPICAEAADEIERLRTILDNMSERNQQQNTQQFKVIRALEAERDLLREISDSFSVCPDGCKDCQNQYEEMING